MRLKEIYFRLFCLFLIVGISESVGAQIPTISIQTNEEIVDEPKIAGTFVYTGTDGEIISSTIGIEIRGGFSQTFPKKTYDIEFWSDASGSETIDVQFGNLREDDDWVLDAMYNEPLRINSFITHKLWLDLNQLYYQDQEPKAKSGADVMYVTVTLNGEYQGIYMLSEQVDRNLLKLKRNNGSEIRGELYKGYTWDDAVLFNDPDATPNNNSDTWSGYEYRYPDEIDWSNAFELIDFVANSSDEAFAAGIGNRFDMENIMDYFILLNVARILDNRGKNIYLCRYDANEPYFFSPWDLDGSWGLLWNGQNATVTTGAISNNLYDRLIENDVDDFVGRISQKWQDYRQTFLSDEALDNRINTAHQFLLDNAIYEAESEVWDYEYSDSDLDYLFNWLGKRIKFLDEYFDDITSVEQLSEDYNVSIHPNPAHNFIRITSDKNISSSVTIYNVLGQMQKVEFMDSKRITIDINDLPSGAYVVKFNGVSKLFNKL
ncbi:MAG: CotH kinase family protein [Bacteroidota bacterium]